MFFYDEEAVIQDADIMMAEYEEEAARIAADRRRGICHHTGGRVTFRDGKINYPEQEGLVYGQSRCLDCGVIIEEPRCVEDGCDLVAFNRGWCDTHWPIEYDRRHNRRR